MSVIVSIFIFGFLIFIHELGHFIAARRSGILVEEFAIGMGTKIASVKKGDTVYSLRLFPFGGFCAMLGENDGNADPRAFNSKPLHQRLIVLLAGIFMNFLLAFILFTGLVFFSNLSEPVVKSVVENSAAMESGLQTGDRIIGINGTRINIYEDLAFALSQSKGTAMDVTILRDGNKIEKVIAPRKDEDGNYKIGFMLNGKTGYFMPTAEGIEKAGLAESLANGFFRISFYIKVTLYGVSQLVTMNLSLREMSGPIGIVDMISTTYNESAAVSVSATIRTMASFMAIISANLAVMNFLPLPALDGGRIAFIILEMIRRKPVSAEKEGRVHWIGFVLLMLLSVVVAYNDVVKLIFN